MENILKDLYRGDINPNEDSISSKEYQTLAVEVDKMSNKLRALLNEGQKQQLESLLDKFYELEGVGVIDSFQDGFRLGVKLIIASLSH